MKEEAATNAHLSTNIVSIWKLANIKFEQGGTMIWKY
jgi:hypothetical protein